MESLLTYLLEHGGCSIQYRIKREIMNIDSSSSELMNLQEQILNKPKVKKVLDKRQPDGWIGDELHGSRGKALDSSVSFLLDNGIEKDSVFMKDVVHTVLAKKEEVPYRTTFKGGDALDIGGRGGNKAVKAGILAELGEENNSLVQKEVRVSLCYLRDSLKYETIDDFSLVNKKGTRSWRNDENIETVKKSIVHCFKIMQEYSKGIMFKSNSHFVGPFNFNWGLWKFNIKDIEQDSYALVWWLRNLYKLSKIGIINEIPGLKRAYDYLWELVLSQDIVSKQNDASLKRFKDILATEENWRKSERVFCDVMFYGVMILFYAGYDVEKL